MTVPIRICYIIIEEFYIIPMYFDKYVINFGIFLMLLTLYVPWDVVS